MINAQGYTYCIGDVQGCYDELMQLLENINYNILYDRLWFVGDLVNRGPKSLETLRFIKNLPNSKVVLGNHDFYLLGLYNNIEKFKSSEFLQEILDAPDGRELINWLRNQRLMHYEEEKNVVLAHAGIYPGWTIQEALVHAHEIENMLRQDDYVVFLRNLYSDNPEYNKLRFIVNAFTRMRFCDLSGNLDFSCSDEADKAPAGFLPWFKIPERKTQGVKIVFGHWAALMGVTNEQNVFALDTGCVWGNYLTALRLEDFKFTISHARY